MQCTPAEVEQLKRFETVYGRAMHPTMLAIERRVCGCDYGGNSWLSRRQANQVGELLGLAPGKTLLDLGAGSGWPALYLAERYGCEAVLVDLPEVGLRLAEDRAKKDGIGHLVRTLIADAAELPFTSGTFHAISHCDLLCCLKRKKSVLANCRRVIRDGGRMVFTVIVLADGLSDKERQRAIAGSPDFVEAKADYRTLLEETNWSILDYTDITNDYEASCVRQIEADIENADRLAALLGEEVFAERLEGWRDKLSIILDGLVLREMYVATT